MIMVSVETPSAMPPRRTQYITILLKREEVRKNKRFHLFTNSVKRHFEATCVVVASRAILSVRRVTLVSFGKMIFNGFIICKYYQKCACMFCVLNFLLKQGG